ncbi:MAG TPA: hypothetical protein ENJ35_08815, partial [Gammaproteobacteria bacterium]|nr:hypothetical protein [Gammaproteobacteria bacterium]
MLWIITGILVLVATAILWREISSKNIQQWFGSWLHRRPHRPENGQTIHVMFAFTDHFEPQWERPDRKKEDQRVSVWEKKYPELAMKFTDADGRHPVHSFFYPEEEYRQEHLRKLERICNQGMGEIEIHLHHDDDTEDNFRNVMQGFIKTLHEKHGALSIDPKTLKPVFSFIHGNWALDNAHPEGHWCGINNEITILKELGCYADMTLPSAPDPCQTSTINSIYYVKDDPQHCKSHDIGQPVQVNGRRWGDLLCVQGPLGFNFRNRKWGFLPRIENADVSFSAKPTPDRVDLWVDTAVQVEGRPEWVFIKVHGHC